MKTLKSLYITSAVGCTLLVLSACRVTKTYERPDVRTDSLYRDLRSTDTATIASLPYQEVFSDSILQKLIKEGLEKNNDLKTAIAAMEEALASFKQSKAAFLPSLSVDASITESKPTAVMVAIGAYTQYQLQATTSWEADIWGKLKSSKKVMYANLLKSDAARKAVLTQLIADIANSYYALMAYDNQLAITEETLKNRLEDVKTMKSLKAGDVVTGADLVQSEANRYAASLAIPDLLVSIRATENALCVLLGRPPGNIERSKLQDQRITTDLAIGVPAQLLANRPDVQDAEFGLIAAFETTNVARTNFYPALTLTGSGGLSRTELTDFFSASSTFFSIIGGLTQPIFAQGANKAQLRTAEAQQKQALYAFEQSLLNAGSEVSNALFTYQMAKRKTDDRKSQLDALTKAVSFTKQLLQYTSATNYTDVLTAEQNLLTARLSGVNDKLQEFQSVVELYRALGGGWR
ncbi:efflux transporter outer membrane subunit [Pedobacter sp. AW1-32]|uniref:efflux transporter outer membrane subunit n=1 Tax=Pedobacter sp. AW1-32 TaxID=3383026 RepID=UPI003FEFDC4C